MVLFKFKILSIFPLKCVEILSRAFGYKKEKVTGILGMWNNE
jgi:hypothetical protein